MYNGGGVLRKFVAARLRKRRDSDIIEAIKDIEPGEVSELIRKGLRAVLNSVKQPEVKQKAPTEVKAWKFPG